MGIFKNWLTEHEDLMSVNRPTEEINKIFENFQKICQQLIPNGNWEVSDDGRGFYRVKVADREVGFIVDPKIKKPIVAIHFGWLDHSKGLKRDTPLQKGSIDFMRMIKNAALTFKNSGYLIRVRAGDDNLDRVYKKGLKGFNQIGSHWDAPVYESILFNAISKL